MTDCYKQIFTSALFDLSTIHRTSLKHSFYIDLQFCIASGLALKTKQSEQAWTAELQKKVEGVRKAIQ